MNFFKGMYKFFSGWIGAIILVLLILFFIAQGFIIPSRSMVGTFYEGDALIVKKFSYGITIPKIPWIEVPIVPDFNNNRHLIEGKRPARGDIVVFNPPGDDKTYFVKRTFATGGDKVIFAKDGMYLRPSECENDDKCLDFEFKGYEKKKFLNEMYIKEPYSKEKYGIHYGGDNPPFSSFYLMQNLANNFGVNNNNPNTKGIAMNPMALENDEIVFFYKVPKDQFFMLGDNRDNSDDSRMWGSIDYSRVVGAPWFSIFSITLRVSNEVNALIEEKNRYMIRWERMFKSVESLESMAKKTHDEPYLDSCSPYYNVCKNALKD